jgi:hypothetical protein
MLRTTAIGLVSAIALSVSLASPAGAMGGQKGGGGPQGGGGSGGGSTMHGASGGGGGGGGSGAIQSGGPGRSSAMTVRSDSSSGRVVEHDMGRMRMGEEHDHDHDRGHDRDHDHDRHDHDRFRFFPAFAYGVNTYADTYDPTYGDCWELHRVWRHGAWRLHRFFVCN